MELDPGLARGAVVLVQLDPATGREQGKTRPAVVVSRAVANAQARLHQGLITVVPITSNTERVLSFQARVDAGRVRGKAQAEQVRAISVSRVIRVLAQLDAVQLAGVDEALRVHLGL
jgi:mRNA interferase MazF